MADESAPTITLADLMERLDKIDDRLGGIEARLKDVPTFDNMLPLATRGDVGEATRAVDALYERIERACVDRDLREIRADLRLARAS